VKRGELKTEGGEEEEEEEEEGKTEDLRRIKKKR
jgi:hypothetical protein